jgi:hypothetical protein
MINHQSNDERSGLTFAYERVFLQQSLHIGYGPITLPSKLWFLPKHWHIPTTHGYNPLASQASAHWMMAIYDNCGETLEKTHKTMKYMDRDRADLPKYSKGTLVMVSRNNIRTPQCYKKLDLKLHGPFEITQVLSVTAVYPNLPAK